MMNKIREERKWQSGEKANVQMFSGSEPENSERDGEG
jgi:hypothetical protein